MTHHILGSSRATPSRIGGFTSKRNKCFMSAWRSPKCSRLRISTHNTNLSTQLKNLAPKTWISQRKVGESSRGCQKVMQMVMNQLTTREGWRAFYRESGKLAVGVSETRTCPGRRSDMSGHPLWNPAWGQICPVRDLVTKELG
jgi:hypothetical protein